MKQIKDCEAPMRMPVETKFTCTSVTEVRQGIYIISLNSGDKQYNAVLFSENSDPVQAVNKTVLVTFRVETVDSMSVLVANGLSLVNEVHQVNGEYDRFLLYAPDQVTNKATIRFRDLPKDKSETGIVFVQSIEFKNSVKSTWLEMNLLDCDNNVKKGRLFSPDNTSLTPERYYLVTLREDSAYGIRIEQISSEAKLDDWSSAEDELQRRFILGVATDVFGSHSNAINLASYRTVPGSSDIRILAYALSMAESYNTLNQRINYNVIKRCILGSFFYLFNQGWDNRLDNDALGLLYAIKMKMGKDVILHLGSDSLFLESRIARTLIADATRLSSELFATTVETWEEME